MALTKEQQKFLQELDDLEFEADSALAGKVDKKGFKPKESKPENSK